MTLQIRSVLLVIVATVISAAAVAAGPSYRIEVDGLVCAYGIAPGGAAVADNGDLLVADVYNHRVQRLEPDGTFVHQWGSTSQSGTAAASSAIPPTSPWRPTVPCTWPMLQRPHPGPRC